MSTQQIKSGETAVFVGDSITALNWFGPAVTTIDAAIAKPYAGSATGGTATATGPKATVTNSSIFNVINSGVGGDVAANIAAAVPARILQYSPQDVILEIGVNDLTSGTPTPLASFRASVDSIFSQVLAAIPTCRLWAISIFVYHEQWTTGPQWANPFDGPPAGGNNSLGFNLQDYNAQLQASVISFAGLFIETRTETLTYEAANNLPMPGAVLGVLTIDGLHPNATGQTLMSNRFLTTVQIVP